MSASTSFRVYGWKAKRSVEGVGGGGGRGVGQMIWTGVWFQKGMKRKRWKMYIAGGRGA